MKFLHKNLKFLDVFSISSGAMISSGIFILPGLAFAQAGPSVALSYLLAGSLALVGCLSVVELSTAMPKAGGDYYFTSRTLGPLAGTVSGFLSWSALSLKTAFAIFGLAEIIFIFTGFNAFLSAALITIFFTALNVIGVKAAAALEVFMVIGLLIILAFFIFTGIGQVQIGSFIPFIKEGCNFNTVLSSAGFVFIAFGGLLNVSSISEEVINPKKVIPKAMISSVITITVLYVLMLVVTIGVLPANNLSGSMTPIADAAKITTGNFGYIIITIAAVLAFVTTANAGIMAAARYPLALSRDNLIPNQINKVTKKSEAPIYSLLLTCIFIIIFLLLDLEILVKAASTVILTSFIMTNLSVIILRESKIPNYRPSYKAPLYPWLQIVGIILFAILLVDMGLQSIEICIGLFAVSIVLYFFYGRKVRDEYALLHLIERITDKKLTSKNLNSEFREILHNRDEIVKDDFDNLIENSTQIDLEEKSNYEELFKIISEDIARDTKLDKKKIFNLLLNREQDGTTAITDFVAIPHIIIEETEYFKIFLIRSKEGISFSDLSDNIKAVFLIIGSREKRSLHLKSLAAIAQIIQNNEFENRWLEVKDKDHLRDIVLLGDRKRQS